MNEKTSIAAGEALRSQIYVVDEARVAALFKRDRGALEDILSEELIYVHSSGRTETKDVYIDRVAQGFYDYRSFVITRRDLCALGEFVFDNGDADIDIVVNGDGNLRQIASRYLMVWRNEGERWRLFRFHAIPIERAVAAARAA